MALDPVKNFAKVTVSTGYNASATSIVLSGGHGALLPSVSFNAVWWNWTDYKDPADDPNVEIVRVTGISTDTLTVTRAQESTSASTKNTSAKTYKMIGGLTAKMITDIFAAIPVKAAGSEIDTGTDDAKFVTAKAINDSHNVPDVAPGTSGNVLTSNGTDWTSATPAASTPIPKCFISDIFGTPSNLASTRYTVTQIGTIGSFATFGNNGIAMGTGATSGEGYKVIGKVMSGTQAFIYSGSPAFTAFFTLDTRGTTGSWFIGMGQPTAAAGGHTYTDRHIGFKIVITGSVASLYATQANGTTETASSALTTLAGNDSVDVVCVVNGSTSVDYYWRKNGGAFSAATNLTTNMPTVASDAENSVQFSGSNNSTASASRVDFGGWSYQR